jgi:hypothetical protein
VLLLLAPVLAQADDYGSFFGGNSRLLVWYVAQLHLMFGSFVLGVPLFATIIEIVGIKTGEKRYDDLAHELVALLAAAFSTTAALGGLLTFALFALYPNFMAYLTKVFAPSYFIYTFFFFAETFCLYFYYYSWDWLAQRKGFHISLGVMLNLIGTILMLIANSWVTFMMSPTGVEADGQIIGTTWEAMHNPLWIPVAVHRLLGNITFGGFVVGAYAAVRFLGAQTEAQRASYDWMGYVGNFVGLFGMIFLPFAGYYLGREIYSYSAVMGNNMMGGDFSWTFIIQAALIGGLFFGGNYYLWSGMGRIPGAERYEHLIKYINILLIFAFAVWITPHNLPLSGEEAQQMGGSQYHPLLKYLGLMPAKNAVVNLIILSTFFSFLMYRRANKGALQPFSSQGSTAKSVVLLVAGLAPMAFLTWFAIGTFALDPATLDLSPERAAVFQPAAWCLVVALVTIGISTWLTFLNRGRAGQALTLLITALLAVGVMGVDGFIVMIEANPFLRNVAVTQFVMVLAALWHTLWVDIFLFRNAEEVGGMRWGKMTTRSQYVLILLCVDIVMLMGLMGFIRSGLRTDWHIYGVMRDTSPWAFTPTNAAMTFHVGIITLLFLGAVAFLFWLSSLAEKQSQAEAALLEASPSPGD